MSGYSPSLSIGYVIKSSFWQPFYHIASFQHFSSKYTLWEEMRAHCGLLGRDKSYVGKHSARVISVQFAGSPAEFNNDRESYMDIDCEAAHKIYSKH
jgi:hypothetical protein